MIQQNENLPLHQNKQKLNLRSAKGKEFERYLRAGALSMYDSETLANRFLEGRCLCGIKTNSDQHDEICLEDVALPHK